MGQSRRVRQQGTLRERQLHDALVRLAGADPALVRPHRNAWIGSLSPLPLLDDCRVGLLDQGADPGEGLATPVAQLVDPRVYELRRSLVLLRGALRHARRRYCGPALLLFSHSANYVLANETSERG